jgi:Plasmid stabilization system protein
MTKRQVVWSERALTEFGNQVRYIFQHNEAAAAKMARLIREAGHKLGERPTGRPGVRPGLYEKVLPGSPYILIYSLEIPDTVTILHVFHGAQDWRKVGAHS